MDTSCLDKHIPGSFHLESNAGSCCAATDEYYVPMTYKPETGEEDIALCVASGISVTTKCKSVNGVDRELVVCGDAIDISDTRIDAEIGSVLDFAWYLSDSSCLKPTAPKVTNQAERYEPCFETLAPTLAPTTRLTYPPGTLVPPPKDYTGEVIKEVTSGLTRTHIVLLTLLASFALMALVASFIFALYLSCCRKPRNGKNKDSKSEKSYKKQWKERRNRDYDRDEKYSTSSGSVYGREVSKDTSFEQPLDSITEHSTPSSYDGVVENSSHSDHRQRETREYEKPSSYAKSSASNSPAQRVLSPSNSSRVRGSVRNSPVASMRESPNSVKNRTYQQLYPTISPSNVEPSAPELSHFRREADDELFQQSEEYSRQRDQLSSLMNSGRMVQQ